MKIAVYQKDVQDIYQYVVDNQDDPDKVELPVKSLRKLLKQYEREVKRSLQKESKKAMTTDVRNKVSEFENDLQTIRQYRKIINRYYNFGQLFKFLWNKRPDVIAIIKDFLGKREENQNNKILYIVLRD